MLIQPSQQHSILVVEDEVELNAAYCEILAAAGFCVQAALDGEEALECLQQWTPDAILCDIGMPGMDGYVLLQHIRASPQWRTLPFVFLTGHTLPAAQVRARMIGIEDYLTKPVDNESLVVAIQYALRRQQQLKAEMQQQVSSLHHRIVGLLQHEFRTPLTFIIGYAEYLMDTSAADLDRETLRVSAAAILDGGRRLQQLIESFLLLADLQNNTLLPSTLRPLPALQLLHTTSLSYETYLTAANLTPIISEQNSTARVNGVEALVGEALRCLFDNAICHQRPESAHLWLSVEVATPYVGFRIRDEGISIPQARLEQLVHPFEQLDQGPYIQPGVGLSLALAAHIAGWHGGKLEVTSEEGHGSIFTLWLPAAPALS